jgi:ATP-dependent protease ClpP protease subunit
MYINSPGGSVASMMAIYDTMQFTAGRKMRVNASPAMDLNALLIALVR